ncbi:hypothetical protein LZ554_009533 [Drepanopeziza brunnea f. sp. 'monogermtubi']|nr:hypothetical protein LZ554_009533 [Drepanopeziza brunnea f. sp. 'monogermtubi']
MARTTFVAIAALSQRKTLSRWTTFRATTPSTKTKTPILDLDFSNLKKEFRTFKITKGIFKGARIAKDIPMDMPKATKSDEVKL